MAGRKHQTQRLVRDERRPVEGKEDAFQIDATEAGIPPAESVLGTDTFEFKGGIMAVRADPRSQVVSTSINYLN